MFFDAQERLRSVLTAWTSLAEADLLAQASAGRSWFRPDDLVRLGALISELQRRINP